MPSRVDAESLLAIDVGSVTTRAALFDVVDGRYRFIAGGAAPSTASAPYHHVSEGVRLALDQLGSITGRMFIGADERLIMPAVADGSGVDTFVATTSAGDPIRVIAVGLLEPVSLESARRLAQTTYTQVVDSFSLNDRRQTDSRLNTLIQLRPDLIIAAGGAENGASQSVIRLMEAVGLAGYLSAAIKPEVLFVGNQSIRSEIESSFHGLANLHFAPNVRPDLETELLDPAHGAMARLLNDIRSRNMPGMAELNDWAGGAVIPSATGFGKIVRFLSKNLATKKGVLGVDVGASATTLAVGRSGRLNLNVYSQLGLGRNLFAGQTPTGLADVRRWLVHELADEELRNYLYNKARYPEALPIGSQELAIEQALVRQVLATAVRLTFRSQGGLPGRPDGLLPGFEAIVASGSAVTQAPNLGANDDDAFGWLAADRRLNSGIGSKPDYAFSRRCSRHQSGVGCPGSGIELVLAPRDGDQPGRTRPRRYANPAGKDASRSWARNQFRGQARSFRDDSIAGRPDSPAADPAAASRRFGYGCAWARRRVEGERRGVGSDHRRSRTPAGLAHRSEQATGTDEKMAVDIGGSVRCTPA